MENQPKDTEEFFWDLRHPLYTQVEQGTHIGIPIAPQGNCRPCYITIDDIKYKIKYKTKGAGEMPQQLKALAAPPEALSQFPPLTWWLTLSILGSYALFWLKVTHADIK